MPTKVLPVFLACGLLAASQAPVRAADAWLEASFDVAISSEDQLAWIKDMSSAPRVAAPSPTT